MGVMALTVLMPTNGEGFGFHLSFPQPTFAKLAIRIPTSYLIFLLPYDSCWLIGLHKCPVVQPIGIGEVLRRIIGRTFVKRVITELKVLGGDHQLCMGRKKGIEHAIVSLRAAFKDTDLEAILLIDTKHVCNSLNRNLALRKIENLCPFVYHPKCNSNREPSNLLINQQTIFSQEGTTQGDPLVLPMYGIAITA